MTPASPLRPTPDPAAAPAPGAAQDRIALAGRDALRRAGGFALLGCSLWLVTVLAFFRSIIRIFS
ncbi:hypothetical protein CR162_02025 [Pseudoroseomonas rhizosphaerae]|uniref:Uncharacterized protein n=1 Tax=Teichococcus rhizosphaerae TaxID=1335062 RepID=A0A2C7AHK5_9PROT|nr:hypothetical protein [Pseudoroseomonas rhizosphaerae]PHK96706.1 hypothetical protein CR162_02025 [Pseudoroseomonas rhizosphaerae]